MAVKEVNLLWTGRGAKEGLDRHRTYTRIYEVITDDPNDDEQVVANASGIPILGTSHPSDNDAVVVNISVEQHDESNLIWGVTIEYDSDPPTHDKDKPDNKTDLDGNPVSKEPSENPLTEPAVWTLTFEDSEEPAIEWIPVDQAGNLVIPVPGNWASSTAYKVGKYVKNGNNVYICTTGGTSAGAGGPAGQANGQADGTVVWNFYATFAATQNDPNWVIRAAVWNSGGLPFDPPATTSTSTIVLSVTKNMSTAALEYLLALKNGVNVVPWRGVPNRCAKIKNVTHDGGKEKNGIPYVTTKWEIALNGDTWDLRLLDQGYGYLMTRTDPVTLQPVQKYVRFVDINGEPLDHPVPMNGKGSPLEPLDPPVFLRGVPRQQRIIDFNDVLPF